MGPPVVKCLKCSDLIRAKHLTDIVICKCGATVVCGSEDQTLERRSKEQGFKVYSPEEWYRYIQRAKLNDVDLDLMIEQLRSDRETRTHKPVCSPEGSSEHPDCTL